MSDPLARIRVKETHGIRRFLYPLSAIVDIDLPTGSLDDFPDMGSLRLVTSEGNSVPLQASFQRSPIKRPRFRLDFALSVAPLSETVLELRRDGATAEIQDPLRLSQGPQGSLKNVQERFTISLSDSGAIENTVYDGISHLSGSSRVTRGGEAAVMVSGTLPLPQCQLSARVEAIGRYSDGCPARTSAEITACKSWVTIAHQLEQAHEAETVEFTLPFAVTSLAPTYDLGNGIYGKLPQRMTWENWVGASGGAQWSVKTDERTDYVGTAETPEQFLAQRWFHLVDGGKALAVAITQVPPACHRLTISITSDGHVQVSYELEGNQAPVAEFGVCYHFLNGIPAIAAATNPQSILLPPTVDVLPV